MMHVPGYTLNFSAGKVLRELLFGITTCMCICASDSAYAVPAQPSAYPGEYVVTVPKSLARGVSTLPGRVASQALNSSVQDEITVLRRIGSRALLISSPRQTTSRGTDRHVHTASALASANDDTFCKDLIASGVVDSCTPNYRLSSQQVGSSDPMMGELWGLSNTLGVAASSAWEVTAGSEDVIVAVIDTGVDYNHPDLASNIWVNPGEVAGNGIDDDGNGYADDIHGVNTSVWATNRADPFDDNRHGTHVAGTIGAIHANGIGISGVSPHVRILPIKFMDANGSGRLSDAIAAIDYMVDLKVNRGINIRISNNSWGGGAYSPALREAIERARDAGIVFVVAAGNSGEDLDLFPGYPASYEVSNVLSVAAIDRNQNLASFSNYGTEAVDIAAPGADIISTLPNGSYGALSGTSMAAPHVAGALALLFAEDPSLSVDQAISRVLESGRELPALTSSDGAVGLIRSRRALDASKLVRNQVAPVPPVDGGLPVCGYTFETAKVVAQVGLDLAADRASIINQVDEGGFYRVDLPFDFPFYRTTTRVLYISPNGLVYLNEPKNPDYQVAARAPNNSIAAFHTDLTPRMANQGVRVHRDAQRVTVSWSAEQYSLAGQGPLAVRLTLYQSGVIVSTVSFESMKDPAQASRTILGDAFATVPIAPLGLIGISATSARGSATVDIPSVQRQLVAGADQRLDLRVTMVPNCFTVPEVETKFLPAQVDAIKLALSRGGRLVSASLLGSGSGAVRLTGFVNGKQCSQEGWTALVDGVGSAKLPIPVGVNKVTLQAQAARKTISPRQSRGRSARVAHTRACMRVMKLVAQ
jgi:subtilisin family serine protease